MNEYPQGCAVVFGASGGIGRAIARSMAQWGARQVLVYRGARDVVDAVCEDIRTSGGHAEAARCDITDTVAVQDVLRRAHEKHGRVHSVVDATGVLHSFSRVPEIDPEAFRHVIETDIFGLFNIARAAIPLMRESNGGAIVTLGTNATHRTLYGNGLSAISKSANAMMIRQIALEEGRKGIRANMVGAGIIDAGMTHAFRGGGSGQNTYEAFLASIPLRRAGQPKELADLVAFLTSSRGAYVTGQIIHVDGGLTA
jgi:NAD(P)-dependent dehydrogenase (short-subunit alcohol dehydrogenase family)